MKIGFYRCLILALGLSGLLSGCGINSDERTEINGHNEENPESQIVEEEAEKKENGKESRDENAVRITPDSEIRELEAGLSVWKKF